MGAARFFGQTLVLVAVCSAYAGFDVCAAGETADISPPASAEREQPERQSPKPEIDPRKLDSLLDLDLEQLSKVRLGGNSQQTNLTAPSSQVSGAAADSGQATSTADLLKQAPSVSIRRVSAITMDPRVRGYNSNQLNATANGMNQLKTRLDIDTLFSQIDPGIVEDVMVIDGPYTSLYGPGFAFLVAELTPTQRFDCPTTRFYTNFVYGSNAQTLYTRNNVVSGGTNWGALVSYGLRDGNDYRTGGPNGYLIPSSYQKYDGMVSFSFDFDPVSRLEFNLLRTEMNDVELPGVIYDIQNSRNDQYNLRYIIQEDPKGPRQLVIQSWYSQTFYNGNALRSSKQRSFYHLFIGVGSDPELVNTTGRGDMESMGARMLRTFGGADTPQFTLGADWRRYRQRYLEQSWDAQGQLAWDTLYGVPRSRMDDIGALADLMLPLSDAVTVNIGGRIDQCAAALDKTDPIASQSDYQYYSPRFAETSNTLGMAYITSRRKLTEETTLRSGAAFAMRNPELAELYNYEAYVPQYRFGNSYNDGLSTLRPEKNLQIDLGLMRQTEKASYGIRAFFSRIHDYILPSPTWIESPPAQYATRDLGRNFAYFPADQRTDLGTPSENADTCQANYVYVNIDEVCMLGGDLFGDLEVREGLSVFGSMSYVYGVNNTPVAVVTEDPYYSTEVQLVRIAGTDGLPGIYPLSGKIGVRLFDPAEDRWCVEFSTRMVRKQDHPAVTVSEVPAPGFTVFGLRGYYRLRKNLRVSLDIDNLFNRAYTEPGSLAIIGPTGVPTYVEEPGFSAMLGMEARF